MLLYYYSLAFKMCITDRGRHKCQHLGRIRGFDGCQWIDLNEEMMANGASENEPPLIANDDLCRMHTSYKYHDRDTLCVSCLELEMRKGKEREREKGKEDDR